MPRACHRFCLMDSGKFLPFWGPQNTFRLFAPFRSRLPNLTDKIVGNLGVSSLWSHHVERKVKHRNLLVLHCALSLSSVQLFATPQTVAWQAPLSMGILQARILDCIAMPFSRGSSQPRDPIQVSLIAGIVFTVWATRETLRKYNWVYRRINKSHVTLLQSRDLFCSWKHSVIIYLFACVGS